ncbi:bacillithiol system redox-active protein YtxJ [Pedobacter sp. HMF7647]|uniref:Bacillithiol system redox-active protein YtxJ n=1 Tax=Hufsiella arboris TaxID=2695275 RepID=A0A7K1YB44_9SPHI|nr:bacillithiol system redox-active protein YtxJ [Hufsiella arboris]MXV51796.1 bacillithiol system redox-active protein YtxJ [Hufsiella arboris]
MNWIPLTSPEQLQEIKNNNGYSIIFKHSTRCSISMMAKRKFEFEREALPENTPVYFLDLISYRDVSNKVAELFHIHHESPQLLLIKDGECVYETSHGEISAEDAASMIA